MSITNLERNVKPTLIQNLTTAQNVTLTPGYLIKIIGYNADQPNIRFLQVFDSLAANVTLGVTVPKYVLPIPIATLDDNDFGVEFDTAISVALTTTPTGNTVATSGGTFTFITRSGR